MNTRSVCRICQINFNSERILAVNTQEIAWLGHDQSFKGLKGEDEAAEETGGEQNVSRKWNYLV